MNQIAFEIGIIFVLLAANGVFAMAEIAVVSAKKSRLRLLADQGRSTARAALELSESPNRFLSTVQIGITLVGVFAGAFGGATLAAKLAGPINAIPFLEPYAEKIAFGIVVAIITYFSLVLGELVPKRIGLRNPEGIAMRVAAPMNMLSRMAAPLVNFLTFSTDALLRLVGFKHDKEATVSEDEVRGLMQEGVRAGAFQKVEGHIVHNTLELDQLPVREIMTPRPKVIWLNQDDPHDQVWHKVVVSNHSYFPVYAVDRDHVAGIVSVKAIYAHLAAGIPIELKNLIVPPLIVPSTQTVLQLVEIFKTTGKHIAMVTDEFGSIVGLLTLNDVMEAIVGEFASQDTRSRPEARAREEGVWLIDGMLDLESVEMALPNFKRRTDETDVQTLAGYMMKAFGRVPREGDKIELQGYVFEALDMDGHRIDKVLVEKKK